MMSMTAKPMRMAAAGLSLLSVAACAEGQYNEQIGGIAGAAAGAYVGSQVGSGTGRDIAMVAGALLGYWAGSTLARRLTEQDRSVMGQTTNRALSTAPNNQTVTWSNPESGNSGSVTPTSSYKTASGRLYDTGEFDGHMTLALEHAPSFSPLICYEIVFPGDLGPDIAQADFMLNLTNDAWFDHSIGPAQHFHHAQLRAVEEGIPLVRAANSGISAVVDAYGRVRTMAREGEVAILDSGLPGRIDGTLYQFLRPWPFIFLTGLFAALALLGRRRLRPGQSLE